MSPGEAASPGEEAPAGEAPARIHDLREPVLRDAEARFGAFVRERVNPGTGERDREGAPLARELCREAARIGLASYRAPAELGGGGASVQAWGLLLEWLGQQCDDLSFPILISYRQTLCTMLHQACTGRIPGASEPRPDLRQRYLEPMVRGELFGGVAYTEGADPFAFRSSARKVAGGYELNGEKSMIAGGLTADVILALLPGEHGDLMGFLVERDDPGVHLAARDLMGLRSMGVARMTLDRVKVPADRVVITADGLSCAQQFFNDRRLNGPCAALGRAQAIFERCVEDLLHRIRYRLPVTEMQAVQSRIGQLHVALESARAMLYSALERAERGEHDPLWDAPITASKYFVVQQTEAVARGIAHLVGGAAYDRSQPYERALRDIYGLIQVAGTQATLEVDLGLRAIQTIEQSLLRRR